MITVLICAALVAAVVLVDVKPWRRPPVLTVTIRVDTSRFDEAISQASQSVAELGTVFARTAPTAVQAAERIQTAGRAGWLASYQLTKDWPRPADDNPFPRIHLLGRTGARR